MNNLAAALVKAQSEFPPIPMDSVNPHFKNKFASLGVILHTVLPVLNANGLTLLQHPTTLDGKPALRTKLIHAESGEYEEDTMLLVLDKENSQGQGSALSYARRYAAMATLGLVADEDDDGQAASRPKVSRKENTPVVKTDDGEELAGLLADIDTVIDALAVAKGNEKTDWVAKLDEQNGTDWRTDVTSAQMVLAKVRRWASMSGAKVAA